MKLSEYQTKALETALPSALTPEYLVPGLVAEVGELLGVQAKSVRDGWSDERTKAALVKEYGDVAWFTAVILHEYREIRTLNEPSFIYAGDTSLGIMSFISDRASRILEGYVDEWESEVLDGANSLWLMLKKYSSKVTGSTFDEVLETNLTKLAGRKQRNVIGGSGDNR